jgi:outer membrane protein OmpA-like peptidoglycan-associated protein
LGIARRSLKQPFTSIKHHEFVSEIRTGKVKSTEDKEITMKVRFVFLTAFAVCWAYSMPALAQFKDRGFEVGLYGGGALDNNNSDEAKIGLKVRAALALPVFDPLQAEFGYAYTSLVAKEYQAEMMPLDLRLRLCPFHTETVIPYIYAGAGAFYYTHRKLPDDADTSAEDNVWSGFVPAGLGVQLKLTDYFSLDMHGGYNQTFTKDLNPNKETNEDSYFTFAVGFRFGDPWGIRDTDGDGLDNKREKQLGTDPRKSDTDGDGLKDGDEVKTHLTAPLKADTDGDGLSDSDEIQQYKTDPLKVDTDGDGLNDGDEVLHYKTDPQKTDSDSDGLNDGDEVLQYKTDPLMTDTDGDKLNDGDEVAKYRTNPLNKDTDNGTVDDGTEVTRDTDPLNAADDVPKIAITEIGKPIVLAGIVFKTNSAEIQPASGQILNDAYETLRDNPKLEVEINGYTDATGSRDKNMKLSDSRANAVRQWLIKKGIDEKRLTAKGFGPDNPIGDNKTAEGKQMNRRIEFVRTK